MSGELLKVMSDLLLPVIRKAVREELDAADVRRAQRDGACCSASEAARRAHCRDSHVLEALATGALPGTRRGSRWSILAKDLERWIALGKPGGAA